MKTTEILSKLEKVKQTSGGWVALCPSHDDKARSLSINESGGKILLNCFAGCDVQNIVFKIGLEMKDLFEQSDNLPPIQPKKRIAETYDYTDEKGKLLFQAVRYEPKGFSQRQPDNKGGFIWNLQGVRLVLYRLSEVLTAETVFIVEGEKDVEAIRAVGFIATCNPQGAMKWKNEYSEHLRGKIAIILPDNDEAGRKHALQVANSLHGIAREIVVSELPNLKPKGDVSDFFSDGGTVDDIIGLLERAESWQPNGQDAADASQETASDFISLFNIQTATEWIEGAKLRPIPKMLFGELWFEGELCILFADTGKGKSILAVQIADSISKGVSVPNFTLEAEKQTVLYFDFELSDKQFEARYSIKQNDYFTNHYVFDENFKRGEIDHSNFTPQGFKDFQEYLNFSLEYEIAETGAKVLIVDNITYLKNATETAKDALPLMKELIRLKKKFDLSILALAHTPKRDLTRPLTVNDLQGSKMLSNFADSIFAIGESAKDKNSRYLKQIKARNTETIYDAENVATCQIAKPNNFLMFDFLNFGDEREHLKILTETDKKDLIEKVKNLSASGESQRNIAAELGISLGAVNKYVNS